MSEYMSYDSRDEAEEHHDYDSELYSVCDVWEEPNGMWTYSRSIS